MGADDFNPKSPNAMFATILTKMEEKEKSDREFKDAVVNSLEEMRTEFRKELAGHRERIEAQERWRRDIRVSIAALALAGGALLKGIELAWKAFHG